CGSGHPSDSTASEIEASAEAGRRHALLVLQTHPGSMEREKSILEIRVRESALRDAAHPSCADAYAAAAAKVFADSLGI
ncbi:MAG: hypothetical protein K2F79_09365, partial [Muribaculaceae bacterium]|nr:hypothetical protein [Muribaculaceae bacterium]